MYVVFVLIEKLTLMVDFAEVIITTVASTYSRKKVSTSSNKFNII